MESDDDSADFNETRAELFEAISHPARIRILQTLNEKPMGFAELGRAVGIEGGGHLGFHLRKLTHLVKATPQGTYELTGDGKEALWSINALRKSSNGTSPRPVDGSVKHRNRAYSVLGGLLIALVVFGAVAVYQQQQIITEQEQNQLLRKNLATDNNQISNLQEQIATLKEANWKLPTCTATPFSLSGIIFPASQSDVRNLIIPLLQNLSGMSVSINITFYTSATPSKSSYLYSYVDTFAYQVVSESTVGGYATYKVNLSSFFSGVAWVRSDGTVPAFFVTWPVKTNTSTTTTTNTTTISYANSTATDDFAVAMLPFVRQEYCLSLAAEIQFYTSAQFLSNGTSIQSLGLTTMPVTSFRVAALPLNTTSTPTIWDYDLKMRIQSVSNISTQMGPVPGTGITLVTLMKLKAVCIPYSCAPYLVYSDLTIRVTSVTKAGGA